MTPPIATGSMDAWTDAAGWHALLIRERHLFEPMIDGASVGFVARESADAGSGEMLVWRRSGNATLVERRAFAGFANCPVALLFVAEPGAFEAVHERLSDNALGALKLQLRSGAMLLYVIAPKRQLLDDGYEDFVEALGLAFLGACR
ncbi:MAG: hypothetical protein M9885_14085 [Burkholderiaceae bacterium]|nr:hypothetical protein [Burkholderiaceae bacterium]